MLRLRKVQERGQRAHSGYSRCSTAVMSIEYKREYCLKAYPRAGVMVRWYQQRIVGIVYLKWSSPARSYHREAGDMTFRPHLANKKKTLRVSSWV